MGVVEQLEAYQRRLAEVAPVPISPQEQERVDALNESLRRAILPVSRSGEVEVIMMAHRSDIEKKLDELKSINLGLDWTLLAIVHFRDYSDSSNSGGMMTEVMGALGRLANWESVQFFQPGRNGQGLRPGSLGVEAGFRDATLSLVYIVRWSIEGWQPSRDGLLGRQHGFEFAVNRKGVVVSGHEEQHLSLGDLTFPRTVNEALVRAYSNPRVY